MCVCLFADKDTGIAQTRHPHVNTVIPVQSCHPRANGDDSGLKRTITYIKDIFIRLFFYLKFQNSIFHQHDLLEEMKYLFQELCCRIFLTNVYEF